MSPLSQHIEVNIMDDYCEVRWVYLDPYVIRDLDESCDTTTKEVWVSRVEYYLSSTRQRRFNHDHIDIWFNSYPCWTDKSFYGTCS